MKKVETMEIITILYKTKVCLKISNRSGVVTALRFLYKGVYFGCYDQKALIPLLESIENKCLLNSTESFPTEGEGFYAKYLGSGQFEVLVIKEVPPEELQVSLNQTDMLAYASVFKHTYATEVQIPANLNVAKYKELEQIYRAAQTKYAGHGFKSSDLLSMLQSNSDRSLEQVAELKSIEDKCYSQLFFIKENIDEINADYRRRFIDKV